MEFNSRMDFFFVVGGEVITKSYRYARQEEERRKKEDEMILVVSRVSSIRFEYSKTFSLIGRKSNSLSIVLNLL